MLSKHEIVLIVFPREVKSNGAPSQFSKKLQCRLKFHSGRTLSILPRLTRNPRRTPFLSFSIFPPGFSFVIPLPAPLPFFSFIHSPSMSLLPFSSMFLLRISGFVRKFLLSVDPFHVLFFFFLCMLLFLRLSFPLFFFNLVL